MRGCNPKNVCVLEIQWLDLCYDDSTECMCVSEVVVQVSVTQESTEIDSTATHSIWLMISNFLFSHHLVGLIFVPLLYTHRHTQLSVNIQLSIKYCNIPVLVSQSTKFLCWCVATNCE